MTLTASEIFARVEAHIQTNPGASQVEGGPCLYLDQRTGNKCFVGLFIPDGHPAQLSKLGLDRLLKRYPGLRPILSPHQVLLYGLQGIHDDGDNWSGKYFNTRGWNQLNAFKAAYASWTAPLQAPCSIRD